MRHAERELRLIGAFVKDGDYDGIGPCVMALVQVLASQGHSGGSVELTIDLFNRVARFQTLAPLKNPLKTGEYIEVSGGPDIVWQSTRRHSVFSEDGGQTWYDIDKRVPRLKRWFGVKRAYIQFAEAA
jgi:hypothetical protein